MDWEAKFRIQDRLCERDTILFVVRELGFDGLICGQGAEECIESVETMFGSADLRSIVFVLSLCRIGGEERHQKRAASRFASPTQRSGGVEASFKHLLKT